MLFAKFSFHFSFIHFCFSSYIHLIFSCNKIVLITVWSLDVVERFCIHLILFRKWIVPYVDCDGQQCEGLVFTSMFVIIIISSNGCLRCTSNDSGWRVARVCWTNTEPQQFCDHKRFPYLLSTFELCVFWVCLIASLAKIQPCSFFLIRFKCYSSLLFFYVMFWFDFREIITKL